MGYETKTTNKPKLISMGGKEDRECKGVKYTRLFLIIYKGNVHFALFSGKKNPKILLFIAIAVFLLLSTFCFSFHSPV